MSLNFSRCSKMAYTIKYLFKYVLNYRNLLAYFSSFFCGRERTVAITSCQANCVFYYFCLIYQWLSIWKRVCILWSTLMSPTSTIPLEVEVWNSHNFSCFTQTKEYRSNYRVIHPSKSSEFRSHPKFKAILVTSSVFSGESVETPGVYGR